MKGPPKTFQTRQKLESGLIRSWWVILFILGCYLSYEHGLQKKDHDFAKLQVHYAELQKKKKMLLGQQEDLTRQINSQSDPAWVELALMKGLGLAPEGQIKVLFTNQKELLDYYKPGIK
ncbi:MAG TPA: hypothetical protein VGP47_04230 [Parachlamydiaceae bacterium]|nr:hypothetical protein [Parachlamydiaceae bacterium]